MNPNDVRALNDAIKELTKALKGGGDSGGSTPGYRPDSPTGELNPLGIVDQRVKALQKEKDFAQDVLDLKLLTREQETNLLKELEKKGAERNEQEQKLFGILQLQGETREQFYETSEQILENSDKLLEIETKQVKIQAELTQQRKDAAEYTENMVMSFGQMIGMRAPKKGGIVDAISSLVSKDKGTRQKALEGISKGLKTMFSPLNIATSLFEKLTELFIYALKTGDEAAATFAKVTGQGREMASASMQAAQAMGSVSANLKDLAAAAANAQNALAGIAGMTRLQASEFGGIALSLERLGVSTSDMTGIVSQGMVGFGETSQEAAQRLSNLQESANLMGMSFSELASSFASNQGSFAAYGHNMTKSFLRTQSTARQLGIELSNLVQLGEKFDTFESAAETVADLNYIMGGQFLDTMEMMAIQAEEGPEGVARAIREQMEATGQSFEDFSYHQQKALAQSLDMSVGDAQKFLSGAIDDSAVNAVENAVAPVDTLIGKANSVLTLMEHLANVMQGLALSLAQGIFGESFKSGADFLNKSLQFLGSDQFKAKVQSVGEMLRYVATGAVSISGAVMEVARIIGAGITSITSKLGMFGKILGKILGPVFSLFEIGKDIFQSLGLSGDDKRQQVAQQRLARGGAGALLGGFAGSAIPGLGTIFGAVSGYSIAAGTAGSAFANGGNVLSGGTALVGEKGPEIVTLPTGANVIPNNAFARRGAPYSGDSSSMGKRDVTVHVKLDVNDRKFREMITLNTVDVIEGRGVLA